MFQMVATCILFTEPWAIVLETCREQIHEMLKVPGATRVGGQKYKQT